MVEVIDLLSSPPMSPPPPPPPSSLPPQALRSSPRRRAAEAAIQRQQSRNDSCKGAGWEWDPFASSPPARRAERGQEKGIDGRDLLQARDDGFFELSSDGEVESIRLRGVNVTATATATATLTGMEISAASTVGRNTGHGGKDFFFLSDDFDTTVDLENDCALNVGPAAKKRKITPVLKAADVRKSTTNVALTAAVGGSRGGDVPSFKRAVSDITHGSRSDFEEHRHKVGDFRRWKTSVGEDDPVLFTSSPDIVTTARERREKARRDKELATLLDENEDPFEDLLPSVGISRGSSLDDSRVPMHYSSESDLPDLPAISAKPSRILSRANSTRTLGAYKSSKASDQKTRDKARNAAEKATAKEAEKERKRLAKEEKAREKQVAAEIAKVNTLRTDKKVSTPEMIVDLPLGLDVKLANQVKQFSGPLAVQVEEWDCTHSVKDVICWRRKVEAKYNEELGYWEPTPRHVQPEKHVMCIMQAKEFVKLTSADEGMDLDAHAHRMKAKFGDRAIIYLIEGLSAWMRKNRNAKNRQFVDAVRNQMGAETTGAAAASSQRRKGRAKEQQIVDEDMIEDALLRLQVIHGALIHHTATMVETAQWIIAFTQHISTIPYRHQRMTLDTAFCMESGQVKTGNDAADTFLKMLQEVNRITAPIAYGIAAAYPSASQLVAAFDQEQRLRGRDAARDLLQTLRKSANRDGAFTDRELGKRVSRRVWAIFMGRDEGSTDV